MMTAESKELFRKAILRVLDGNRTRFGLPAPAIGHGLPAFGFHQASTDDIADSLDYLASKELVEEVQRIISRENRCWRITRKGIALLDEGA